MKQAASKKIAGYSLVEMLMYVGLLSVTFVAVVNMLVTLTSTYRNLKVSKDIDLSALTAMERMTSEIKTAESINVGQSSFASTSGTLALNTYDSLGAATVVKFSVSNGLLRVSEGGVDKGALVASTTFVPSLVFYSLAASSSQAVRVELTVQSGTSTTFKKERFYTSALLRGSYKNR